MWHCLLASVLIISVSHLPLLVAAITYAVVSLAQAKYSGGSGTAQDPYQIATAEDLIALGETPQDYDKHFILTADIDLADHVFDKAVIAPDIDPHTEWGFDGIPFTGVFDGNERTISHLTVKSGSYLGLLGWLEGEVKNLGVVDVNMAARIGAHERAPQGDTPGGRLTGIEGDLLTIWRTPLSKGPLSYGYVFTTWSIARPNTHLHAVTGIKICNDWLRQLVHAEGFVYRRPKHTLKGKRNERAYRQAQKKLKRLKRGL